MWLLVILIYEVVGGDAPFSASELRTGSGDNTEIDNVEIIRRKPQVAGK